MLFVRAYPRDERAFGLSGTKSTAIVEEYLEGREIYVGVMGNDRKAVRRRGNSR